jgi:hypothetical protein
VLDWQKFMIVAHRERLGQIGCGLHFNPLP